MKIAKLRVHHVKGVRTVEIVAHPTCNEIAGPNGAGKSTLLDCIRYVFGGKREIDPRALREGASKGEVMIETDEISATLRLREGKGSTLTVKAADGEKRGQNDLKALYGTFSFDPLAFSRMALVDQIVTLRQLVSHEYVAELEAKDTEIKEAEEERTLIGRKLRAFGQLEVVEEVEPVDVSVVAQELREIEQFNRLQDKIEADYAAAEGDRHRCVNRVEELRTQLATAEKELEELEKAVAQSDPPLPRRDTSEVHAKLAEAGKINAQAAAFVRYREKLEEQQEIARQSEDFDRIVSKLREEREALAQSAKLPVDGLVFGDGGIRVNGLPFEQLSSSEKIRISARIGMASNAALRVMLIKDGSLLDDGSWKELVGVAEEHDYQLWVETVGEGHGDAIVLEDGEIKESEGPVKF